MGTTFISEIGVFSDIRNSIFWYQKLFFLYQISEILIFWYQKIGIKVQFGIP